VHPKFDIGAQKIFGGPHFGHPCYIVFDSTYLSTNHFTKQQQQQQHKYQQFTPTIIQKDYKYSKVNSHDFPQLNFTDFAGCENHAKVFYGAPAEIMRIYTTLYLSLSTFIPGTLRSPSHVTSEISYGTIVASACLSISINLVFSLL